MINRKEILAENQKARLQFFLQSNQATIDYAKSACNGALLLNGAAIIPIVYSKVDYLFSTAICFGMGAGFAVLAACMAYLAQWLITSVAWQAFFLTFRKHGALTRAEEKAALAAEHYNRLIKYFRSAGIAFLLLSLAAFGNGLWQAYVSLPRFPHA